MYEYKISDLTGNTFLKNQYRYVLDIFTFIIWNSIVSPYILEEFTILFNNMKPRYQIRSSLSTSFTYWFMKTAVLVQHWSKPQPFGHRTLSHALIVNLYAKVHTLAAKTTHIWCVNQWYPQLHSDAECLTFGGQNTLISIIIYWDMIRPKNSCRPQMFAHCLLKLSPEISERQKCSLLIFNSSQQALWMLCFE